MYSSGFSAYYWRGEPIKDINAWAKQRGDKMVRYKLTTRDPYGDTVEYGKMPETFWNSLMFRGNQHYEELGRDEL